MEAFGQISLKKNLRTVSKEAPNSQPATVVLPLNSIRYIVYLPRRLKIENSKVKFN